jgi:hypothetical protein
MSYAIFLLKPDRMQQIASSSVMPSPAPTKCLARGGSRNIFGEGAAAARHVILLTGFIKSSGFRHNPNGACDQKQYPFLENLQRYVSHLRGAWGAVRVAITSLVFAILAVIFLDHRRVSSPIAGARQLVQKSTYSYSYWALTGGWRSRPRWSLKLNSLTVGRSAVPA